MGLGLLDLAVQLWLWIVVALCTVVAGVFLVPSVLTLVRATANLQRRAAGRCSGLPVDDVPEPVLGVTGARAVWRRLIDPMRWREALWTLVNPMLGLPLALVPITLLAAGLHDLLLLIVWAATGSAYGGGWLGIMPLTTDTWWLVLLAVLVQPSLGVLLARPALRFHGHWARFVLGSERLEVLRARAEQLQRSRTTALELQEAEIARIERDLHDGAQARLVAVGMSLSEIAELVHHDPDAAVRALALAQDHSKAALDELRHLVRGIRPPVLADRGLVDAVRSLAAQSPVPTEVEATLDGRLAAPLESAIYFAVAELHTNALKHASASRIDLSVRRADELVIVEVRDDGCGGAPEQGDSAPAAGGLSGLRRRLEPLDGVLRVSSPIGGPTVARVEVPAVTVRTGAPSVSPRG